MKSHRMMVMMVLDRSLCVDQLRFADHNNAYFSGVFFYFCVEFHNPGSVSSPLI